MAGQDRLPGPVRGSFAPPSPLPPDGKLRVAVTVCHLSRQGYSRNGENGLVFQAVDDG